MRDRAHGSSCAIALYFYNFTPRMKQPCLAKGGRDENSPSKGGRDENSTSDDGSDGSVGEVDAVEQNRISTFALNQPRS
ncbi:hypothetical protein FRE64_15570 [Euhalothece natronophila Z-M001]|uniref:Uncharacterized protein n=1 Tax=Euhalothece natronophila Z-M001 TaxID=522448 RepID=A0A5B8NSG9_9CHRO|nr:hypothetical protein [Euhalothece natronophila]QDZ41235.1 hypothetical protein FRE64_15570 [Euhalothece natronophila Z-M001]